MTFVKCDSSSTADVSIRLDFPTTEEIDLTFVFCSITQRRSRHAVCPNFAHLLCQGGSGFGDASPNETCVGITDRGAAKNTSIPANFLERFSHLSSFITSPRPTSLYPTSSLLGSVVVEDRELVGPRSQNDDPEDELEVVDADPPERRTRLVSSTGGRLWYTLWAVSCTRSRTAGAALVRVEEADRKERGGCSGWRLGISGV